MTAEEMEYIIGKTNDRIIVPKGFVTDFASIPQPLWSFGLTPHGQYSRAAVIHDFLYWAQGCTKEQADRLMVVAMKESNVGSFDETVIYDGLYIGGKPAWNANAAERKAGLPRIVPAKYLKPPNPNVKWAEYRQELVKAGVKDPEFETRPSYCKYGDSTTVP
ncbi:MAG: hypothetical protein QOD26_782 [Betaproteobacteria bacterium]|nr:hypothetical protein [Betaproteobacteria bacterium]